MLAPPTRLDRAASAIPALAFSVLGAKRVEYAAVPTLSFSLRIDAPGGEPIRSILLDTQIQIAARRRSYEGEDPERLFELFGAREQWGTTLRTLLWARTTAVVPPFTGTTVVELPVVCTYDLEVAASRYFDALHGGEVPLEFLFSGAVFYGAGDGGLQVVRIPWDHEAELRMDVSVWKETMSRHFPGTAWLRVGKESFDRLGAYKARHGLTSVDAALEHLLDADGIR